MSFLDTQVVNSLQNLTRDQFQPEEIILDDEMLQQLSQFNLLDTPIPIQDHFIRVRHAVRKFYIEVVGWEKLGYEIRYTFHREQSKAVFKTIVNGQNEFKNSITPIPRLCLDTSFNNNIADILARLPNCSIKRNTVDTIIGKIEFDLEMEEKFPFTKCLYEDMLLLLQDSDILIDDIEHLRYKERYTFRRGQETVILDFEYKQNGFFGRVVPLLNQTNSPTLLTAIQTLLQRFKQEEYAS